VAFDLGNLESHTEDFGLGNSELSFFFPVLWLKMQTASQTAPRVGPTLLVGKGLGISQFAKVRSEGWIADVRA